MMPGFDYFYQGLSVRSEFPIPEWELFAAKAQQTPSDVVISLGDGSTNPDPEPGEYVCTVNDDGWFRVNRGREIVLITRRSEISRRLRIYLTGTVWGAILYQRGALPVHASAVQFGEGAVMFCGRRGQGKSTLAASLAERGYRMVSDDVCCVSMGGDGPPLLHPSLPRLKLCADSARELGWNVIQPVHNQTQLPKMHYYRPGDGGTLPQPLSAIYLLAWGDARIHRLEGFTALHRFLNAATWRGDLLLEAGNPGEYFRQCTELVRRIPLWELARPRDFRALAGTVDLLIASLK